MSVPTFVFYYEGNKLPATEALLEAANATWSNLPAELKRGEGGRFNTSLIENRIGRTIAVYWRLAECECS